MINNFSGMINDGIEDKNNNNNRKQEDDDDVSFVGFVGERKGNAGVLEAQANNLFKILNENPIGSKNGNNITNLFDAEVAIGGVIKNEVEDKNSMAVLMDKIGVESGVDIIDKNKTNDDLQIVQASNVDEESSGGQQKQLAVVPSNLQLCCPKTKEELNKVYKAYENEGEDADFEENENKVVMTYPLDMENLVNPCLTARRLIAKAKAEITTAEQEFVQQIREVNEEEERLKEILPAVVPLEQGDEKGGEEQDKRMMKERARHLGEQKQRARKMQIEKNSVLSKVTNWRGVDIQIGMLAQLAKAEETERIAEREVEGVGVIMDGRSHLWFNATRVLSVSSRPYCYVSGRPGMYVY